MPRTKATAVVMATLLAFCMGVHTAAVKRASLDGMALPLERVAFGSCNHQAREQPLWPVVLADDPQLWIWMGDAIYGDYKVLSEVKTYLFPVFREAPPEMLLEKYSLQMESPGYQSLTENVPVIGTWDDHDYGINDGDKTYSYREQSQQVFLDFIGEPLRSPRRDQQGVYTSYTVGSGEQNVKFILLDARYHKDPYDSRDGDFLGTEQWRWLEHELSSSTAAFNVVVSGVQILPEDRFYGGENWNWFPAQRQRLLNTILKANVRGAILLSGDVHYAEVNQVQCDDFTTILTEITSSGMTHSWDEPGRFGSIMALVFRAANAILPWDYRPHRGAYFGLKNFGQITFDWDAEPLPRARVRILGEDGHTKLEHAISSHYAENDQSETPARNCRAIRESSAPVILVRRIAMVGFVGLLVGGILSVALTSAWLLVVVFGRSYTFMMKAQRQLFDRGYQKLD